MESSVETTNNQLATLQKKFEEQKTKYIVSLEEMEKRMTTELQTAEAAAKQVEQQLQEELKEQTTQKEESQNRVQNLTQKVSSLENECKTKELELTTLRVQVAHGKETVERMQREHDSTKAQLKAKEEQLVCP